MSLDLITEGSKDYIKYVLQLSEAKKSSTTKTKKTAPAEPKLFDPVINVPTEDEKRPIKSAGSGGRDFMTGSRPIEDEKYLKTDPHHKKNPNSLVPTILFGGSKLPDGDGNMPKKPKKGANGEDAPENTDESGGLSYLTNVAQGASVIDFADQNLPAVARLALAAAFFGEKVKKTPGDPVQFGALTGFQKDLIDQVKKYAGGKNLGPLGDKVFKYTENLGALDPFNPLLGLKLGYEMLGGNEILKRTRELGAAQSSGAQSSMGHPSGFGYYGR